MTDSEQIVRDYNRARKLASLEKRKGKAKSSKRKRTEKMNRELAAKKKKMWFDAIRVGWPICGICRNAINCFPECEIDHIDPRGMGGGKRDDSDENLRLTHSWCNRLKGSKRNCLGDME